MRCKKVILAGVIVAIVAAALGFAWYFRSAEEKQNLAFETFAPQFQKVEDLRTRFKGQLKVKFVAENNWTPEEQEKMHAVVDNYMDAINEHILDSIISTYSVEELKMKSAFESGDYMQKLMNANSEINVAIKVYAQHLNRLGTLDALRENFDQEKGADELREVITKLSNDTMTPDQERLQMIADELKIPQQQAVPVLILLALSQQAVEMQNHYLNPTFEGLDQAYVEDAKHFIELNHLNTMLEDSDNFLRNAEDVDFDQINDTLKSILAAVVVKHVDHETLKDLNAHFETEEAQDILVKDIELAGKLGPEIKDKIETMQNELKNLIQLHQNAETVEHAEGVVEEAEKALEDAKEAIEEETEAAVEKAEEAAE